MARRDDRHWWDRRWGERRHDVWLRYHGDRLLVEARLGGAAGASRVWQPPTEEDALQLVDELLTDQFDWVELTARP